MSSLVEAVLSEDRKYRYTLTRGWGGRNGTVTWVMLNPSTADEFLDDPTIRRCIRFSAVWGYSNMTVVNLFAYRATDPRELLRTEDPVGSSNYSYVSHAIRNARLVVAAWGANVGKLSQKIDVEAICRTWRVPIKCLGVTQEGHPRHPLYMPVGTPLVDYGQVDEVVA